MTMLVTEDFKDIYKEFQKVTESDNINIKKLQHFKFYLK
jgi:hypothetical protein